jgi:hypothetical protein
MKLYPAWAAAIAAAITASLPAATVITYEAAALGGTGVLNNVPYTAAGVKHSNSYNPSWGSWSGFAISNHADTTTAGWTNQYSSYTGGGAGGSAQFAVGYVSSSTSTTLSFSSALSVVGYGADFTNTTYTGLDMLSGSGFSKKFGGADGTDPDFLTLTITGYLSSVATGAVDFQLADYRSAAGDYIVNSWTAVDFSPLGTVDQIRFTMSSSDNGAWGMNTPSYFAMDNLMVPEPSTLTLAATAGLLALRRRRA